MGWQLFRRDADGCFEMVGLDGELLTAAPIGHLPIGVEIRITAPSALPDALGETESAIDSVTEQLGGRIAGTVRAATEFWTLVYLPTDELARRYADLPLPKAASISVAPANDPAWTLFERVRPVGMEEQSLQDVAVFQQLHAAGDAGGVRRIDHVVTGLDADRLESFGAAVASIGLEVGSVDGDVVELRHDADPADITADTWTIRLIAERHGATYDGWGCGVLRDEPRPQRGSRRWFRRS